MSLILNMNERGPIIALAGFSLIVISILLTISVVPSNILEPNSFFGIFSF
jgi:hypothetical protein